MTAHERADRLLALLIEQSEEPPFIRPSGAAAPIENAIEDAERDLVERCAKIADGYGQGAGSELAKALRALISGDDRKEAA